MWTWSSTGDVIIQKYWDACQPDSYQGTEEDCLEMGVAYNLRWNDAECSRQLSVLCEDG
ncbi:hypothetical protein FSP39_022130 [Pinctada imbricata]|uniref:C-type lectin domain-containing protein n=1 Tax=Pinctada imbricata TaxID=66713 RepID=A0AA88XGM5_PINIB|nr:hypothetical protein FSP39_022130 [Pinctada imbricata]